MDNYKPLVRGVFASIADQATLSGTNFTLNVLLARWLTSEGYGAFSVAASVLLILASLHNALILEPMSIVGPAEFGTRLGSYLKLVGKLNWIVIFLLGLMAAGAAIFYRGWEVRDALTALGVALPGYLLLLTVRRVEYILNQPLRAFYLSAVYVALLAGTVLAFHSAGKLTAWSAVLATGFGFVVALGALARRELPPDYQPFTGSERAPGGFADGLAEVCRAHWGYGKWLFGSALIGIGISDLQVLLLSKMVDLNTAGVLRALMNFILPVAQLLTVLSVYSLPKLARRMSEQGIARGLRAANLYAICILAIALLYSCAVIVLGAPLEHLLYGGRLAAYVQYLPWLAAAALFSGVAMAFTTPLRAAQNSQHALFAGLAGTAAGLASSLILLPRYGLEGALFSLVLANAASALVVVATFVVTLRKYPAGWTNDDRALVIFDENLTTTSPVGSCLLKVVHDNAQQFPLHLFYNRLDLSRGDTGWRTHIPLPAGPVILRSVLFTALASLAYWLRWRDRPSLRIATQGVFPFCDVSYAQFCHRIFLRDHRADIGGAPLRRLARYLIHIWGSLTERMAFERAKTIVVPSEGLAYELQMAYPDLVAGKISIIPNPVDTSYFRKPDDFRGEPLRLELGCAAEDLLLCFCALGNFERKGLRQAIEALAELGSPNARLVVVGGKPGEIREYEKLCADARVGTKVRFVGMQNDIRPYLWSSDVFLFPSSYEAFPLVCLQAAAARLPLIATRVYGVDEFMIERKTGWIVERSAKAIAFAIAQALHNRAEVAAMGRGALERVLEYGDEAFCARWRTLLGRMWAEAG